MKAKRLRRDARDGTVGKPHARYVQHIKTGTVRLHPECTKSVYRELKKGTL